MNIGFSVSLPSNFLISYNKEIQINLNNFLKEKNKIKKNVYSK